MMVIISTAHCSETEMSVSSNVIIYCSKFATPSEVYDFGMCPVSNRSLVEAISRYFKSL